MCLGCCVCAKQKVALRASKPKMQGALAHLTAWLAVMPPLKREKYNWISRITFIIQGFHRFQGVI